MPDMWDEARLQQYITDEIEESLTLEYKAAAALDKKDDKKKQQVTKDVSAMANSAGGILIYGIAEYDDKQREHLPEKLDPVDRTQYSKEWLENIITNIRPRIDGLVIHSVSLSSGQNDVVYVVEIPQSTTAHQATSKCYYKRFNFKSEPMYDYEIRDVMGRGQYPKFDLEWWITIEEIVPGSYSSLSARQRTQPYTSCILYIRIRNIGHVYAQYVNVLFQIPKALGPVSSFDKDIIAQNRVGYYEVYKDNTVRDIIDDKPFPVGPICGPSRYEPILPGRSKHWGIPIWADFQQLDLENMVIFWTLHADNAPQQQGERQVSRIEIEVMDRRPKRD
jgi:hypothetical protein